MPEVSAEWAAAASNLLSNIRSSWTNCTVLTAVRLPGAEEDREKIWDPSAMFSEDLWLENDKKLCCCSQVEARKEAPRAPGRGPGGEGGSQGGTFVATSETLWPIHRSPPWSEEQP